MQTVKLGELIGTVIDNRGRNPNYYSNNGYPILEAYPSNAAPYPNINEVRRFLDQNMYENFLRKYLEKDDVCITLVGTIGNICLVPSNKWVIIQNSLGLRPKKDVLDAKYLFYYLKLCKRAILALDRGSSQPSVLQGDLLGLPITLPDLPTQQSIASVLFSLDSKISLNNKINTQLESLARLIYDYWFVQFDFPDENGKPYKSSGGKMVWSEELKREVPEGWEVQPIGEFADIYDKQRIPLSDKERKKMSGGYPYYGATGIFDYINQYIFDGEYILLAEDGSIKDGDGFCITQYIYGKTWVNNHAHVIAPKDKKSINYLFFVLSDIPAITIETGSIQKKITQDNLLKKFIIVPRYDILEKFESIVATIRKKLIVSDKENRKLTSLRDWLLPLLMNGQVEVMG